MAQRKIICNKLDYLDHSSFVNSLRRLRSAGGVKQKAAEKVTSIIGGLGVGLEIIAKLTKQGEKRIKGCIKYDLPGACRLVTVETEGVLWLLFVGDHEEEERWLENNKGWRPVADKGRPGRIQTTRVQVPQTEGSVGSVGVITDQNLPMLQRFSFPEFEELIPQKGLQKHLLAINESTDEDEILETTELIQGDRIRELIFDLIVLCRDGNYSGAKARLKQYRGEAIDLLETPNALNDALLSGENSDTIIDFGNLSKKEVSRLLDPQAFENWMLYLHPDQQKLVDEDYEMPAVLKGVSGSGKTVVLIHRARRLAKKYPDACIGILTLNRSLAKVLRKLVDDLCLEGENERIKVDAYYDYFQSIIQEFGSEDYLKEYIRALPQKHPMQVSLSQALQYHHNIANDFDPIGNETLDDTWREFWTTHINDDERTRGAKGKLVETISGDFNTEAYIRDEFTLVRSAFSRDKRASQYDDGYLNYERSGRTIPLREVDRKNILSLLLRYEEVMLSGAILDESGLSQVMMPHLRKLRELPHHLQRRCLLIDEFQDFSTLELRLLKQIPTSRENGLFLAGDTVQKVLVKDFNLGVALLDRNYVNSRAIKKNYRNSKQILTAAHSLIESFANKVMAIDKSIEILNPEYAVRETSCPIAIQSNNPIEAAWQVADEWIREGELPPWSVCIVTSDNSKVPIQTIIGKKPEHLKAAALSGDYSEIKDTVSVGYLSDVKGLEFSVIIIIGVSDQLVPNKGTPKGEQWRDALRLYVAMTRGRDQVVMTYQDKPSEFLLTMKDHLIWKTLEIKEVPYNAKSRESRAHKVVNKELKFETAKVGKNAFKYSKITAGLLKHYFRRRIYKGGGIFSEVKDPRDFDRKFLEWVCNPTNLEKIDFIRLTKSKDDRRRAKQEVQRALEH